MDCLYTNIVLDMGACLRCTGGDFWHLHKFKLAKDSEEWIAKGGMYLNIALTRDWIHLMGLQLFLVFFRILDVISLEE